MSNKNVKEVDLIYAPGEESERFRESGEHVRSVMDNIAQLDVGTIQSLCGAYLLKPEKEGDPDVLFTMAGSVDDLLRLFEAIGDKIMERMNTIEMLTGEHGGES